MLTADQVRIDGDVGVVWEDEVHAVTGPLQLRIVIDDKPRSPRLQSRQANNGEWQTETHRLWLEYALARFVEEMLPEGDGPDDDDAEAPT